MTKVGEIEWTEGQIDDLLSLKKQGYPWDHITKTINKRYGLDRTQEGVRTKYRRIREQYPVKTEFHEVQRLKESARLKRINTEKNRENRLISQHLTEQEDIVELLKKAVSQIKIKKIPVKKKKANKGEKYTIEALLSDVHVGKLTKDFNRDILQKRLSDYACKVLELCSSMNVERIILPMLGDLIESQTMHGIHSARGCEFSTAEQIQYAVNDVWEYFFLPIALEGITVDVYGIAGNHDRDTPGREYHYPGRHNFTFVIYNTLSLLSKSCGFTHVSFYVPDISYITTEVYDLIILYEHGDVAKSINPDVFERMIQKRSRQTNKIIDCGRFGHFHTHMVYDSGRVVLNGGMPGGEGYADSKGYTSIPGQSIQIYSKSEGFLYSLFVRL